MTYILKSRRVRRGMPLGDDSSSSWFSDPIGAITGAASGLTDAISGGLQSAGVMDLSTGKPAPTPSSSGPSASSVIDAIFGVFNKPGIPTAPTTVVVQKPGMSPTTMIALAVGGVALVALLARRSS